MKLEKWVSPPWKESQEPLPKKSNRFATMSMLKKGKSTIMGRMPDGLRGQETVGGILGPVVAIPGTEEIIRVP